MSKLLKEILDKLAENLSHKENWPDDDTYYHARRLYYRLKTIEEAEAAEPAADSYGEKN